MDQNSKQVRDSLYTPQQMDKETLMVKIEIELTDTEAKDLRDVEIGPTEYFPDVVDIDSLYCVWRKIQEQLKNKETKTR